MDIRQGTPFCQPCKIYAGRYSDAAGSDIVVITSGIGRKPGQSRLDLAQTNVNIMKSIASEISVVAPNAMYVIVSNPVDVLTYVFNKVTNVPESHIIGTGTLLDTARLRSRLSDYLNVSQQNIHAYVLGEHGDSSFVPWSSARVCNVPLEKFKESVTNPDAIPAELNYEEIENYMRTSGGKIIQRKGATFYAIAISVCHICQCILDNGNAIVAVSTMLHGEYGLEDVCLSIPTIINANGVVGKVLPDMTDEEVEKMTWLGISGIANVLCCIKMAKYYELTENDVVGTVLTDSAVMYKSRIEELNEMHGAYNAHEAALDHNLHMLGLKTDSMMEMGYAERKRVHNLKYYTWVEQQQMNVEDLNAQWYDTKGTWDAVHAQARDLDELINEFNEATGLLKAL